MRHRWIIVLLICMLLSGCQKNEENNNTMNPLITFDSSSYTYAIPFKATDTRNYHSTYQSRYDMTQIGIGMERYSKEYYDTEDYYALEGQIITRTILSDLVARESENNPQGLNPAKGSEFLTGNKNESIIDAVIVSDVFELDFTKKDNSDFTADGLTVALIVNQNQTITTNGVTRTYRISDDRLWEYASNAGRKLESYLRTLSTVQDIPILVLIYNTSSSDAVLPGGFIGYGHFSGRVGQFTKVSEKWVLIPTNEASELDKETTSQFNAMKNALKEYLPENINIIAQAQYIQDKIEYIRITVAVQAKTYVEVHSLTQYCAQLTQNFTNQDMRLVVHVKSNDETFAIIERSVNEGIPEITYLD